jgi:hypothetical protein
MRLSLALFGAAFLALLLLSSVGAFLLFVPLLSLMTVVLLLVTLLLVFALGVHAGGGRIEVADPSLAEPGLEEHPVRMRRTPTWDFSSLRRRFSDALRAIFESLSQGLGNLNRGFQDFSYSTAGIVSPVAAFVAGLVLVAFGIAAIHYFF